MLGYTLPKTTAKHRRREIEKASAAILRKIELLTFEHRKSSEPLLSTVERILEDYAELKKEQAGQARNRIAD